MAGCCRRTNCVELGADDQRIFSTQLCKLGLQRGCLHRVLATGLQLVNDNDPAVGCLDASADFDPAGVPFGNR